MTRLTLDGLTLHHPGAERAALSELALKVERGEMLALLGPSGCGKTTALRVVAGLIAPDAGDVRLDGESVLRLPPEKRDAVLVFQSGQLFAHMTVAANVGFGLRMRRTARAEIARRVGEALEQVQLAGFGDRRPHELSGGQRQRVALARALVLRPKVLLLDEPLSALDANLRGEMRALVRRLQRETGITTLVVTHDQEEAAVLGDRVALMLDGRIRQIGAPRSLWTRPADLDVARFFGGCNFIPGRSSGGAFDCALGRLALPEGAPEGQGCLTLRPEAIEPATQPGPNDNVVGARILDTRFEGLLTRITAEAGGQRLEALMRAGAARGAEPGRDMLWRLPPEALWVLPGV
ncbi:ABC transporter ATP-binding protein [Limimaricola pyoseonensis]|uniref:Putative spermidine/putrescine transport system ATP-binding protein n=1 Tax=Limimaricola pyoseonensis TaxID=521013 RepID=A0A1G7GUR3_9RHOB|nr:ABC transporter ATP-binding protein [Limimaricola pyoseonensis]SDE91897.1 putative spermidine/putrescine transport system ATP-binding protein [Limimaricola pyoseonensis]